MRSEPIAATMLTRRTLLKAAAAASGALLAAPLALPGLAAPDGALRVGLLLPRSSLYPQLGAGLLSGLKLALDAAGPPARVLIAEYGTLPSAAAAAGRRLVEEQGAQILVGTLSSAALGQLRPLLEARRVPLIAATAGANVARAADQGPYIFRHTLGLWQASQLSGAWAAANLGRRAFVAASFHDSGYDALDAFRVGFEQGGGRLLGSRVTHLPGDDGLGRLMAAISAAAPDLVYAAYAGPQAAAFLRAYAEAGLQARVPLVGSGLFGLGQPAPAGQAVLSGLGWSPDLDSLPARQLRAALAAQAADPAAPFAALGYDAGLLIAQAAGAAPAGAPLREALAGAAVLGARGPLSAAAGSFAAPLYLRETRWAGGAPHARTLAELPASPALAAHAAARQADLKTGWTNAYLCV